jgi:hypothetical protein
VSLGSNQTIDKIAQLIKGESSYYCRGLKAGAICIYNYPHNPHNALNPACRLPAGRPGSLPLNDATTGGYIICRYGWVYIPHARE